MTDQTRARVIEVFEQARSVPAAERDRVVAELSGGDAAVRDEVLSLLRFDTPTEELSLRDRALAACLALPHPVVIGRYRIVKQLGSGGFGSVYLAERDAPRQLVALKLLRPLFTERDLRRFRDEGEALARLRHPGIAQVYDAGVWEECEGGDGRPYIAMEYVEGVVLGELAEASSTTPRKAAELMALVADAIAHAHQRGVIHRDLTARNVIVDAEGRPKVLDFGLARLLSGDGAGPERTITRDGLAGTLAYMSPEQLSSETPHVDTRCDVYALGVLTYLLLTGRLPIDVSGMAPGAAAVKVMKETPVRPSLINRAVEADLDAVVLAALAKDPALRYQSAAELAADLRRCTRSEPVSVRRATVWYRLHKLVARHRAAAAACAIALVSIAGAGAWSLQRWADVRRAHAVSLDSLDLVMSLLQELTPQLGTLAERERALAELEGHVRELMARLPDDPRALAIGARFLSLKGEVLWERGEYEQALRARGEAMEAHAHANGVDPTPESGHALSLAIVRYGDALDVRGRRDEAVGRYFEALALDERLHEEYPTSIPILSNLFWSLRRLDNPAYNGDGRDTREFRKRAHETARRMMEIDPEAWRSREAVVEAACADAVVLVHRGEHAAAYDAAAPVLAMCVELLSAETAQRHLYGLGLRLFSAAATAASRLGRDDEAAMMLATVDRLGARLREPDADRFYGTWYGLVVAATHANIAAAQGDDGAAMAATLRGLRVMERAAARMSEDETFNYVYALGVHAVAERLMRGADDVSVNLEEIVAKLETAIERLDGLVAKSSRTGVMAERCRSALAELRGGGR